MYRAKDAGGFGQNITRPVCVVSPLDCTLNNHTFASSFYQHTSGAMMMDFVAEGSRERAACRAGRTSGLSACNRWVSE